jgi:hypothetical protein
MPCRCSECRQNAGKAPIQCRYRPAFRRSVQIPRRKNQGETGQAPPEVCKAGSRWNRPRVRRRCASCRRYHLPP